MSRFEERMFLAQEEKRLVMKALAAHLEHALGYGRGARNDLVDLAYPVPLQGDCCPLGNGFEASPNKKKDRSVWTSSVDF